MPSPFPGMDPFLEVEPHWTAFRHHLLGCLHQALIPNLAPRYSVRISQRTYTLESVPAAPADPGERTEEFLQIRDRDGRLVTLLDVVGPANKTTPAGRQSYLATRADALAQGAGVAEIDLVRQGKPTWSFSREGLPQYDYSVTVCRASSPDRYEIYTATLARPLTTFKLPLAPDDRDLVLDLRPAVAGAYDAGEFAGRIDYRGDPVPTVRDDVRWWLNRLLREKGLRGEPESPGPGDEPSADELAVAAYFIWEREGRPDGRAREHWHRATEQLRRRRG